MYKNVYSEFEIDKMSIKFEEKEAEEMNCIGSIEEELGMKKITKKCRGRVERNITKGDGTGTLKISAHVPYEIYTHLYGMDTEEFADEVMAYGENCVHPECLITCHVKDEDEEGKYKAYPRAVCTSAKASKIENGSEEVAEIELEFDLMPDANGKAMYEALEKNLNEEIAGKWMSEFSEELIKKVVTV